MASVASVLLTWPFRGNHSQLTVFITRLPQLVINSHFLKMTSIFLISDGYPFRRCCRLHPLHPIQGQRLHEPSNTYSVGLVTFLRSTCFPNRKPAQVTCTSAHGNTQAHTLIIKAPIVVVVICVFHNARSAVITHRADGSLCLGKTGRTVVATCVFPALCRFRKHCAH